jgi:hypothetical protein
MGYPSGRNLRKSDRKSKENQDDNKMILKDFEKIFLDLTSSTLLHLGRVQVNLTLRSTSAAPSPQAIPPSRSAASGRTLKDNS